MKLKVFLSVVFALLFLPSRSFAESSPELFCFDPAQEQFDETYVAGYNLSQKHLDLLKKNYATEESLKRTREGLIAVIVERIAKARKDGYDLSGNSISDKQLATEIYNVAIAFGHDPVIFAAMLEVESSFRITVLGKNGAGLSQMTSIALQELTYQYEKDDVGDVFAEQSQRYFGSGADLKKWLDWISVRAAKDPYPKQTKSASKYNFKRVELAVNYRYALAAGASSLKIQLAFNKGHYGRALTDYNSVFSNYDNRILDRADKMNSRLDKLHTVCPASEKIHAIQRISCEMALSRAECEGATRKLENSSVIFSI